MCSEAGFVTVLVDEGEAAGGQARNLRNGNDDSSSRPMTSLRKVNGETAQVLSLLAEDLLGDLCRV